jgi:hypothetical protein
MEKMIWTDAMNSAKGNMAMVSDKLAEQIRVQSYRKWNEWDKTAPSWLAYSKKVQSLSP